MYRDLDIIMVVIVIIYTTVSIVTATVVFKLPLLLLISILMFLSLVERYGCFSRIGGACRSPTWLFVHGVWAMAHMGLNIHTSIILRGMLQVYDDVAVCLFL